MPPTATLLPSATPTPPPTSTPLPAVQPQLALGDNHSCLLHADGKVSCWGWNEFGQSGHPVTDKTISETAVPGLTGITRISAGAYHTCALDWQGDVYCWGRNNNGQLGNGSTTDSAIPVKVSGLDGKVITQISAGSNHTCALDQHGQAYCWGSNRDGKLGGKSTDFAVSSPQPVEGIPNPVTLISAGSSHTCAVDTAGGLWCWGAGDFGQVGLAPFANSAKPNQVTTLTGKVVNMEAGWFHTCLLNDAGAVLCWGKNQEGELGNAAQISRADLVGPVDMAKDVRLLAVGGQETCAVKNDDTVWCWGRNPYGQIGDQTRVDHLIPWEIHLPGKVTQIAIGGSHACALGASEKVYCWGADDLGQLGSAGILAIPTPTPTVMATK
jgi:alpha-tubulin suppressor-like RCC1 family protein